MFKWFKRKQSSRIGLALGGGGTRGLAHIGVLKVLTENKIPIDYIAGTSAGAIVAAMFAAGISVRDIEKELLDWDWLKLMNFSYNMKGLFSTDKMGKRMRKFMPIMVFGKTKIPLKIVATDFLSARPYIFGESEEDIITAVCASSSVPVLFSPVPYKNGLMVDGGLVNNIPISVVRDMGADKVLGVNVIPTVMDNKPRTLIDIVTRTHDVTENARMPSYQKQADFLISPIKDYIEPFPTNKKIYKKLVDMGEREALDYLPHIQNIIS